MRQDVHQAAAVSQDLPRRVVRHRLHTASVSGPDLAYPATPLLTYTENLHARRQFACALAMLNGATFYWLPDKRRIAARVPTAKRGRKPVPPGAIPIGYYTHPTPCGEFLADLTRTLEKMERNNGAR